MLAPHLVAGDRVLVHAGPSEAALVGSEVQTARAAVPSGVVVEGMLEIASVLDLSLPPGLPPEVAWLAYDYEACDPKPMPCGFSPEFTIDQGRSTAYFDRAREQAHGANLRLLILPSYGELKDAAKPWDWGEVAQHTDAIDLQLQSLERSSDSVGAEVELVTEEMKGQSTPLLVQLSLNPRRGTPADVLGSLSRVEGIGSSGVEGVLIHYLPQSLEPLAEFLGAIVRGAPQ
jgi:hypothetical protein